MRKGAAECDAWTCDTYGILDKVGSCACLPFSTNQVKGHLDAILSVHF